MKTLLLAAALIVTSAPAFAWTYVTDDGRAVTVVQANRDAAFCNYSTGGRVDEVWVGCMRSKGYIIQGCNFLGMTRCDARGS
jgi:hypothetical protein